jgi:hypothetical protein
MFLYLSQNKWGEEKMYSCSICEKIVKEPELYFIEILKEEFDYFPIEITTIVKTSETDKHGYILCLRCFLKTIINYLGNKNTQLIKEQIKLKKQIKILKKIIREQNKFYLL